MPLTPLNPPRISPVGKDASGQPVYQGKDGVPIYGLKDARAFQNYNKARGGVTRMPDMTSPTFGGYSMGRGWKDQRSQPKGVRNEKGDRVVIDKQGNQVPVGNRINARAGNKAVEARDAENAKFFNRARAVNQPPQPPAAVGQQAAPAPAGQPAPQGQIIPGAPAWQQPGQAQAAPAQAAPAQAAPAQATPYGKVLRRKPGQPAVPQPVAVPYAQDTAKQVEALAPGSGRFRSQQRMERLKTNPASRRWRDTAQQVALRNEMDASQQAATAHLR